MYQTQLNIIEKCEFICYCVMTLFFFHCHGKNMVNTIQMLLFFKHFNKDAQPIQMNVFLVVFKVLKLLNTVLILPLFYPSCKTQHVHYIQNKTQFTSLQKTSKSPLTFGCCKILWNILTHKLNLFLLTYN